MDGHSWKQSLESQEEWSIFYSPYLSFADVRLGETVAGNLTVIWFQIRRSDAVNSDKNILKYEEKSHASVTRVTEYYDCALFASMPRKS